MEVATAGPATSNIYDMTVDGRAVHFAAIVVARVRPHGLRRPRLTRGRHRYR